MGFSFFFFAQSVVCLLLFLFEIIKSSNTFVRLFCLPRDKRREEKEGRKEGSQPGQRETEWLSPRLHGTSFF